MLRIFPGWFHAKAVRSQSWSWSVWDLLFGGNRELVWASQLLCTESQCFPTTEKILFANLEVRSSTRGAFKVILLGDQAHVVTTLHVPGQEHCWPPPSGAIAQLPLLWLHTLLLGQSWLPASLVASSGTLCYAVGCSSKWRGISFNKMVVMAPSVLPCFLSLIVQILSASSWLCFGWVWQLKSILSSNRAVRIFS